eukprot:1392734-Amphidinium_carterae.1
MMLGRRSWQCLWCPVSCNSRAYACRPEMAAHLGCQHWDDWHHLGKPQVQHQLAACKGMSSGKCFKMRNLLPMAMVSYYSRASRTLLEMKNTVGVKFGRDGTIMVCNHECYSINPP